MQLRGRRSWFAATPPWFRKLLLVCAVLVLTHTVHLLVRPGDLCMSADPYLRQRARIDGNETSTFYWQFLHPIEVQFAAPKLAVLRPYLDLAMQRLELQHQQGLHRGKDWEKPKRLRGVVDLGAGGGVVLSLLNATDKFGVEPMPQAREHALQTHREQHEQQGSAALKAGSLVMVPCAKALPRRVADFAYSLSALFFVESPLSALLSVRRSLHPGGTFVVQVQNEGKRLGSQPFDTKLTEKAFHLYTWNPRLLGNLLSAAGFHVLDTVTLWDDYVLAHVQKRTDDHANWFRRPFPRPCCDHDPDVARLPAVCGGSPTFLDAGADALHLVHAYTGDPNNPINSGQTWLELHPGFLRLVMYPTEEHDGGPTPHCLEGLGAGVADVALVLALEDRPSPLAFLREVRQKLHCAREEDGKGSGTSGWVAVVTPDAAGLDPDEQFNPNAACSPQKRCGLFGWTKQLLGNLIVTAGFRVFTAEQLPASAAGSARLVAVGRCFVE